MSVDCYRIYLQTVLSLLINNSLIKLVVLKMNQTNRLEQNGQHKNKKCKSSHVQNYSEYLKLDQLLSSQVMLSPQLQGIVSFDEHLFIITHQAFELWFKQILFEIDIIRKSFEIDIWKNEPEMLNVIKRLGRITKIFKLLLHQFEILETMHHCDFAEFRGVLTPASGFQSLQFRMLENKLGLKKEKRVYCCQSYSDCFKDNKNEEFERTQSEPTLFLLVHKWLESTPQLLNEVTWNHYKLAANEWLQESEINGTCVEKSRKILNSVFDCNEHENLVKQGHRMLSHKALKSVILIYAYRNEKGYGLANQILESLVDLDTILCKWRHHHLVMVHRMIGSHNSGTGGTSGTEYLKLTLSDSYKMFIDLINLPAMLIPPTYVPPLKNQ
ncbi:tryptophan 2,3-dioxygenase [Daktulosphaira vitifoliae]|uniref:tryptophan 2,3-dioxygenase n=1 Tax=Daktulosphaira vitifoliae TaxID=58002 RepID=UPI0021A9C2CE|nr:tryptophan 2,3-dioxygenase [Daktulosphaira vitifoliae]